MHDLFKFSLKYAPILFINLIHYVAANRILENAITFVSHSNYTNWHTIALYRSLAKLQCKNVIEIVFMCGRIRGFAC